MASRDKATAAEADPVATRIPLQDEEDWKLVSKVPPREKRAVLHVGNLHKDQDELNLRQYICKRCMGLSNVTAIIDTYSIQTKGEHAHAHVSLNADAAQHLCCRAFWVHPIYARKWVVNDKPAAGIKSKQQGEGNDYQQLQQQHVARDSGRATAVLSSAHSHSIGSLHDEELKLALSPESNWVDYSDSMSGVEEDVTAESDLTLIDHLDSRLDEVRQFGSNIILAGDFNVHNAAWLRSTKTTTAGEALEDVCAAHHLAQHIADSTRGNNTLDLVISDFECPVATAIHPPIGRSDHAVVTACFTSAAPHINQPTTRKVWRYSSAD